MSQVIPQQLGRYVLTEKIASGGMADVYRATLPGVEGFEKEVAIKKILPFWSKNKEFIDMLVDEAKVLLHLTHSNIVQVVELNREEDIYYLVMEYVEGVDLRALLRRLKLRGELLPLPIFFYIAQQICQGLSFAHSRADRNQIPLQIVHRDISPQNILIGSEGVVKITDFGIARAMGRTTETVTGTLKGKFAYMSPEQALGKSIDLRSDLFAVGILLFEMITLTPCFKGKNDLETLEAVKNANIVFPTGVYIPPPLQGIICRAMARHYEDRYPNLEALGKALKEVELTMGETAGPAELKELLKKLFPEKHRAPMPIEKTQVHQETRVEDIEASHPTEMLAATQIDPKQISQNKKPARTGAYWISAFALFALMLMGWFVMQTPSPATPLPSQPTPEPVVPIALVIPEPQVKPDIVLKTEPPSPKSFGNVRVSAKPWGRVYIPGVVSGAETPFTSKKIPVGMATIRVIYPPSNKTVSLRFEIKEGETLRCQASFSGAGSLSCR